MWDSFKMLATLTDDLTSIPAGAGRSAPPLFARHPGDEEDADEVMLVGHNPGLEDLLLAMTGETRRMPTAALACIALDIERWSEVRETGGQLEWLVKPKELAGD